MRLFLVICAIAVALLGWGGAGGLGGAERAGYFGGALTLAGSFVICVLFINYARWLGIGGAAVVALLGSARNAPAVLDFFRNGPNAPDLCRIGIALLCLAITIVCGRGLMAMRRGV
jgi:hypothetical protein